MNLGKQKLKKYLIDRDGRLTQEGLASVLGCGKSYVNRLINDDNRPGRQMAGMIEAVTGIPSGDWDKEVS